jgi:hypothetical protein
MSAKETVSIGSVAAIVAVEGEHPSVLVVAHAGSLDALPFGPLRSADHRTLESGLRKWVGEQTKFDLGYTDSSTHSAIRGGILSAGSADASCRSAISP